MEQLHRLKEARKFNDKLNAYRKVFVPRAEICRDKNRIILMDRWEVEVALRRTPEWHGGEGHDRINEINLL